MNEAGLSERLLEHLRLATGRPTLDYRGPLEQIALGTEARILRFSLRSAPRELRGALVLRLYLPEAGPVYVGVEHAAQNALAAQGFPAPRVLLSSQDRTVLGEPFLIMEHVWARPMSRTYARAARVTARVTRTRPRPDRQDLYMRTLARLHSLDKAGLARAFAAHGIPSERLTMSIRREIALEQTARWRLEELRPLLDWLTVNRPAPDESCICHGDPNLGNLMISRGRVAAMIDWGSVHLSHPEADLGAFSGLELCAIAPTEATRPPAVEQHLARYERHRPIRRELLRYYEVEYLWSILVNIADRSRLRAAGQRPPGNQCLDDPMTAPRAKAWLLRLLGSEADIGSVSTWKGESNAG